jgi:hypothetical protein
MPLTRTSWKPGQSGNLLGRPKNPASEQLHNAIVKVQEDQDSHLLEHFVKRTYTNDQVLIAIMKKLVPDHKLIESDSVDGSNIQRMLTLPSKAIRYFEKHDIKLEGICILPEKLPDGAPVLCKTCGGFVGECDCEDENE